MSDFINSFAQKNMTYNTQTVYSTTPGDNYYKVMIFVGESDAATYFTGTPPSVDTVTQITASNYTTLTQGLLLKWLSDFYANGSTAIVYLVLYTDVVTAAYSSVDLATQYGLYKYTAFWKTIISGAYLNSACEALDALWVADSLKDKKFTQTFFGSADSALITTPDTTSLWYLLTHANATTQAWIVYHHDANHNPALAQLGMTLSLFNSALSPQSPVGSKLGFVAMNTIAPSGTGDINLTSTITTILETKHVGYFEYVGDGTTNVINALNVNLQNIPLGSWWIPSYIDHVSEIEAATLLSQPNMYLNAATYNSILALTGKNVKMFVDSGRFTSYTLTKAAFNQSTNVTSDKKFIISNAWSANYVDDAEGLTVTGTLFINV